MKKVSMPATGLPEFCSRLPERGLFLTGIENSDPVVGSQGVRRDQLKEAHDFYANYRTRLENIAKLGVSWIRFGPRYSATHKGRGIYDFSFSDAVMEECGRLNLTVVADLLHFGLPEWLHEQNPDAPYFQNKDFPEHFAEYCGQFSRRYPQVQNFTMVNEPFVTATFSAKLGIWNERISSSWNDDRAFVRAVANIAKAVILGRGKIEEVWTKENRSGEPVFFQNDSFEKAYAAPGSGREAEAAAFNLKRFAALDLIFGHEDLQMRQYLFSQGLGPEDYLWFMGNGTRQKTVLGIDHYPTCVHTYEKSGDVNHGPWAPCQLELLIGEYWDRYRMPLLHLEVNGWPDAAPGICMQTYSVIESLRKKGMPVLGMSWFGDEYQVGWHAALCGPAAFEETPVGLFYKGQLQAVGEVFRSFATHGFSPINFGAQTQ